MLTSYTDVKGVVHRAGPEALHAILDLLGPEIEGPEPVRVAWDGGPDGLEPGYHRETVREGDVEVERLVISAPTRSFGADDEEFSLTAFLPLYALRGAGDWGVGTFTDLGRLRVFAGERGFSGLATLPLTAAFLDEPCDPSPYAPASRLFLNELYIDVEAVPDLEACPEAGSLLESIGFREEIASLTADEYADPRRLMALKRSALSILARSVWASKSRRRTALEEYVESRPLLLEYARFRAAMEWAGGAWPTFAPDARDGVLTEEDYDERAVRYHLYVQWIAEQQLQWGAGTDGADLCLDLPLGVSADGFDVWRNRDLFALGASGGAPPDDLCETGQDWGFPPLKPAALRADGYAYFRDCLARLMRSAASLRIDHVMGLFRLFWVPRGFPASEGVYVTYPAEELLAILSLESHRHRCALLGENLGTVPPRVNEAMRRHGIRGMYVLPFEMTGDSRRALRPISAGSQASLDTHDLAPFASWWEDLPASDREPLLSYFRRRRLLAPEDTTSAGAFRASLLELAGGPAEEVVVSLEDLWGELRRQNLPGTGAEMRNFRRRAVKTLDEMEADQSVATLLTESVAARAAAKKFVGRPRQIEGFLTPEDQHLLNEGTHRRLAEKLGSHLKTVDGREGTHFAVWAPNAERVVVMGDFNGWSHDRHPLSPVGSSGIFSGFIPDVLKGDIYKYRITARDTGIVTEKADPYAVHQETPPKTASIVWDLEYEWADAEWMASRAAKNALDAPMSVYEVHLGSFMRVVEEGNRSLNYREIAPYLAKHVKEAGFTHVEMLPVMEHPFYGSWGYQVTGYFAPTSRYGTPQDFMALVDHLHREGIGVILDWVPSHFPADAHGLNFFDGTSLYEHADPRKGHHPDWDSQIFNYGRNEVRAFLTSAALHWIREFHVDGLRTDAVASMLYLDYSRKAGEWIPNEFGGRENLEAIEFLKTMNQAVYAEFPDVQTIAEESTAWPMVSRPVFDGGLGFGLKWDMGWMHDTLCHFAREPIHRQHHMGELTFRQIYATTENFMLSLSHDEAVHGKGSLLGKMPGDDWQKFANLRLLFADMFGQTGKKLLFMGAEIAQWQEWNHESSLSWHLLEFAPHRGMLDLVGALNRLYRTEPALHEQEFSPDGFSWVDCSDTAGGVLSFLRWGKNREKPVLVVLHFTPVLRESYRVGVPYPGSWCEVLNTDAEKFGGSGQGNPAPVAAEPIPAHGHKYSVALTLPPLGGVFLRRE